MTDREALEDSTELRREFKRHSLTSWKEANDEKEAVRLVRRGLLDSKLREPTAAEEKRYRIKSMAPKVRVYSLTAWGAILSASL